jgi:riboflavin synthase
LGESAVGHPVNLEVDILARYLERLLLGEKAAESSTAVTLEMLQATGFVA